ncbi:hypothetical protein KKD19_02645, partial [Patescibacteria group bacterium]|nr:hypothetical protein [Patescibacteria group bacterium]
VNNISKNNTDISLFPGKEVYYVFGKLMDGEIDKAEELKDFEEVMLRGEKFYPLLVGQYLKRGIVCYKMRRIK